MPPPISRNILLEQWFVLISGSKCLDSLLWWWPQTVGTVTLSISAVCTIPWVNEKGNWEHLLWSRACSCTRNHAVSQTEGYEWNRFCSACDGACRPNATSTAAHWLCSLFSSIYRSRICPWSGCPRLAASLPFPGILSLLTLILGWQAGTSELNLRP